MAAFSRLSVTAKAIILMVLAMAALTSMDALAKGLMTGYHPLQIVWVRFASQLGLSLLFLAPRLNTVLRTSNPGVQFLRSAFIFSATMFFFFGISHLQLATVAAIFEVGPLLITVLAFFILGEQVGLRRWMGVLAGLIGAAIIIRPGSDAFTLAALLPLGAAASYAGFVISTRMLALGESPWTSFLYTALFGTILASLIVPFVWQMPGLKDVPHMLAIGAFASIGHYLLIRALVLSEVSVLAPFGYFGLLFNALWGFLFFAEVPNAFTLSGSIVIVAAGLYVWHRETSALGAQPISSSGPPPG